MEVHGYRTQSYANGLFTGDFYGFPFPPFSSTPNIIGLHSTYINMLIEMEDFDLDGDFDFLVMKTYPGEPQPRSTPTATPTLTETPVDAPDDTSKIYFIPTSVIQRSHSHS